MRNILIACISISVLSTSFFAQNEKKPCPTIQVIAPNSKINPGETMTFSVKVENELENLILQYDWIVSAGTIIEGQNTSTIKVATTPQMNGEGVTAKIAIQGMPGNCINETSETKQIENIPIGCGLLDDYGTISSGMEKSMLDSLFIRLLNNPETIVFFRLGRKKNETVKQTKSRVKKVIKYANFRKIDKKLLVFAIDKSETNSFGYLTSAYLIPKNKELPECENCEIIKGEDVN